MIKKVLFFLTIIFLPIPAFAQRFNSLQELLAFSNFGYILDSLAIIIITLSLLFFLWGMAVFILNAGSEDKRTEGKQKMLWGIIAMTVMFGIWGIVKILQISFFGTILPNPPGF